MRPGRYCIGLSRALINVASWSMPCLVRLASDLFKFDQTASAAASCGWCGWEGCPRPGQWARGAADGSHPAGGHSRSRQSLCGGSCRTRGPGRCGRSAAAGRRAGVAITAATETRLLPWAVTLTTGVWPRRPQVRPFGGLRPGPDSSSKQSQAPRSAAVLLSPARSPPATRRSPPRPARRPGGLGSARSTRSGAAAHPARPACSPPRTGH